MATQTIGDLRQAFSNMDSTKQKAFILNLQNKLKTVNNIELKRFLAECVEKYKAGLQNGSFPNKTPTTQIASQQKQSDMRADTVDTPVSTKVQQKQKNPLKSVVIALSAVVVVLLIVGGIFVFSSMNNSNTTLASTSGKNNTATSTVASLSNSTTSSKTIPTKQQLQGTWHEINKSSVFSISFLNGDQILWSAGLSSGEMEFIMGTYTYSNGTVKASYIARMDENGKMTYGTLSETYYVELSSDRKTLYLSDNGTKYEFKYEQK